MSVETPGEYQPIVLIVDDDDDDVRLVEKALSTAAPEVLLLRFDNGLDALAMLRQEAPHEEALRPSLVLLDLNMPLMSGRELLSAIKNDPSLKNLPVVVLTTSDDERDIKECYQRHANSYVTKPVNLHEYRELIASISHFWLQCATPSPAPSKDATLSL